VKIVEFAPAARAELDAAADRYERERPGRASASTRPSNAP